MSSAGYQAHFTVSAYDLAATLDSGQAFRWEPRDDGWEGIIGDRWVRIVATGDTECDRLEVETVVDPGDWSWLRDYLGLGDDLDRILKSFPDDPAMRDATVACRGLRLLRQEPWECLASFILSSTKQIVQIRQIVRELCFRYGRAVDVPLGREPGFGFPTAPALAGAGETALRACRMGFRARYLMAAAEAVAAGRLNLGTLRELPLAEARARLTALPGVGRKIADCVLLFSCGHLQAFPVDVWVLRALREAYFPRRRPTPKRLLAFSESYFGPFGGYAQQYLFHHIRQRAGRVASRAAVGASSARHAG